MVVHDEGTFVVEGMDTTYRTADGESTEWDDLQRKFGNLPPKEDPWRPEAYVPKREADELGTGREREASSDEEVEEEDDPFLEAYRKKRMEEMKKRSSPSAEIVHRNQWIEKITERSRTKRVIVHLYDARSEDESSKAMSRAVDSLIERYPGVCFVRCDAKDTVPDFPTRKLPALLVYLDGKVVNTLAGKSAFGGRGFTSEEVAYTLNASGAFGFDKQKQKEHAEELMQEYLSKMVDERETKLNGAKEGNAGGSDEDVED